MPTTDPAPDDLARLAGDLARLEANVRELADIVAQMAGAPTPGAAAVRPWLTETAPAPAAVMLDALTHWLGQVWMHYPGHRKGPPLPECWALHPWAVEELWVARGAYRDATGEHGSYTKLADWHDRVRPAVAARLAEHLGTCSLGLHQAGPAQDDPERRVPAADIDTVADAWATRRAIPAPGRTP